MNAFALMTPLRAGLLSLAGALLSGEAVVGCGLHWHAPRQHFTHVQSQGRLSYHETWGGLRLSDGFELPLVVNFDSGREWSSPVLGAGWMFTLGDSYATKTADDVYKLVMPDGYHYKFRRRPDKGENVWFGNRGWRAQERPDGGFRAAAPCGWTIEWREGKIEKMITPQGKTIDYVRENGRLQQIREQGRVLLELVYGQQSDQVKKLVMDGQTIELDFEKRPLVQRIDGRKVVGALAPALTSATWSEATGSAESRPPREYLFKTDNRLRPTLEILADGQRDRLFGWDAVTGRIRTDNDWTYQIKPGKRANDRAAITRTNTQGQSEYWHKVRGKETTIALDGTKTVREWFVSGPARGNERRVAKNGETVYQATYDENGLLIREVKGPFMIIYDTHRLAKKIFKNGQLHWSYESH